MKSLLSLFKKKRVPVHKLVQEWALCQVQVREHVDNHVYTQVMRKVRYRVLDQVRVQVNAHVTGQLYGRLVVSQVKIQSKGGKL